MSRGWIISLLLSLVLGASFIVAGRMLPGNYWLARGVSGTIGRGTKGELAPIANVHLVNNGGLVAYLCFTAAFIYAVVLLKQWWQDKFPSRDEIF